ncbi:MAG: S46 family peptidase [Acidobacteria bacterium]|nr:S46 family peptidase [Acidobacteriota bacterium]
MRRLSVVALLLVLPTLRADEGMWTFDNVPAKAIKARYGVELSPVWLKNLQLATVRFPGGTGAFVSRDGLVVTNHHVGRGAIAQVSSAKADLVKDGFAAITREQEIKVPGLELMMLVSTEDVTVRVNAAVKPGTADKDALTARRNALAELRKAEEARTGLTCEPVTLYQGGEYWLYRYKKFTDVRLAAAPELQVAAFGGDPDNYTYPRHNLDFALFRVYESGTPYRPEAFLPFSAKGIAMGELTFISGHPGTTFRQQTHAQMRYAQETGIPFQLKSMDRQKAALQALAATSPEARRISADAIYGIENGHKRLSGQLPLVRLADEDGKPSDQRLTEFSDGNLKATKARLLLPRPVQKPVEETLLAAGLTEAHRELGAEHPYVKAMLGGKMPQAVAQAALAGTRLDDPAVRKQLAEGGKAALAASTDPLLALARALDPFNRGIRKRMEDEVTSVFTEHGGRIAEARFKVFGKALYPDATFTLRLGFGPVTTYANGTGTKAQPFTTFMGMFDRHLGWGGNAAAAEEGAWTLPQRWLDRQAKLDLATPFNFIYACDTVGGNSGSPVVNVKGEFVGINFDSVFEGQGGYYVYDADTKRAVATDVRAIVEALRKILDADRLVAELMGK